MKCYQQNPCDEPAPSLFSAAQLKGISDSLGLKQRFSKCGDIKRPKRSLGNILQPQKGALTTFTPQKTIKL